jgi:hypothetical protein
MSVQSRDRSRDGRARRLALVASLAVAVMAIASCVGPAATPRAGSTATPSASQTFVGDCCAPLSRPTYALVTPRPSIDPVSTSLPTGLPSSRPTATPTPADSLSQDASALVSETVPARGSVEIPLDFEGSSWAAVMVYSKATGLTATVAGKALEASGGMGIPGLSVELTSPANGTLVVRNPTAQAADISAMAEIMTRRHVTVEPGFSNVKRGEPVAIDVSMTQASDGDQLTLQFMDEQGTKAAVPVKKLGTGHWTATVTPTATGENHVLATVTGTHFRIGQNYLEVISGDVTVSSTFGEQLVDTDRDGLANSLVISPTITVPAAGKYMVNARLVDSTGTEVSRAGTGEIDLASGSNKLDLEFDGASIFKSGRSGPYRIVDVTVVHDAPQKTTTEASIDVLGATKAYDYMQFQHDRVAIDWSALTSKTVDTDGDGKFEQLQLSGFATVETAGEYVINAGLYADNPWDSVGWTDITVQLSAGRNPFTLIFKGSAIAASGRDGPYVVSGFNCYLKASGGFESLPQPTNAHTTSAYKATQFGG